MAAPPERIATKATREGCEAYRRLQGEFETGRAAARLEQAAATVRRRLATGTAGQTADPGATAVSLIVGASADNVAAWSALFGSIALELAGMIAMMHAESGPVLCPATDVASAPGPLADAALTPALGIETTRKRP